MNIFELIAIIFALIITFSLFISKNVRNRVNIIAIFGLVLSLIVVTVKQGYLWYYSFLYVYAFIAVILFIIKSKKKLFLYSIITILPILFLICMVIFPYYKVPKPTGDFKVGTGTMDITDKNRIEQYNNSKENREIRLQIWYPIDTDKGLKKAKWLYDGKDIARGLSKDCKLPYFTFDKLSKIYSNSYIGGNLSSSKEKYPVVIISHGWRSVRNLYSDYAEELASHGYIVFAIDHTYGSVATVLEDRGLTEVNYHALSELKSKDFFEKANVLVNTFADDISVSIDYIEKLNNMDNMFKNRININEIGLLGHSTGGGADVRLAIKDSRIKSVVGLEPWVAPIKKVVIEKGLNIPSLIYRSKQWEKAPNNENLEILYKNSKIKPLIYQVNGTTHYDFAMVYMYSYITKKLGYSGSIDNKKLTEMLRYNINTFFNETLKENKKSDIVVKNYKDMEEVIF